MAGTKDSAPWGSARARLVEAAQELLIEEFTKERARGEAVQRAFAFLDPAVVAERADVSRSAFYHHWANEFGVEGAGGGPYQRFLAEVFDSEWGEPYVSEIVGIAATHNGTFSDFVRKAISAEWHRYDEPAAWASFCALVAMAAYGGNYKDTLEASASGTAEFFDAIASRFGVRVRPPLTTTDMSVMVLAVLDGFWLRRMYGDPDANRSFQWTDSWSGETSEWNLVAFASMAVIDAMTEPVED